MPFSPQSHIYSLLSVFDDTSQVASHRYNPSSWSECQHYVTHPGAERLEVTVWNHSDTAWVCLRGVLDRRAARALARVLLSASVSTVVPNTAEVLVPTGSASTPLITLCATLSCAGYSVATVGPEDQSVLGEGELSGTKQAC